MQSIKFLFPMIILLFFSLSCSVISRQVRDESLQSVSFHTLLQNANEYNGKTVILGGYILATENKADETLIHVVQAPLTLRDYPGLKDNSEGRFVVVHKGFLDPEIYSTDRIITVAGIIDGVQRENIGQCPYACLKVQSREIYLWPEYDERNDFLYDDPFFYYRYPYSRYPYWRYPHLRHRSPYYY